MAIGDVKLTRVRRTADQSASGATPEAFGAGIGQALTGLARSFDNRKQAAETLATAVYNRQLKLDGFETERRFLKFKREQVQKQDERFRSVGPDGRGLTNQTEVELAADKQAFLETVPEALRERYATKLEDFSQSTILGSFKTEKDLGDKFFTQGLQEEVNQLAVDIYTGDVDYSEAEQHLANLLAQSDLPEVTKSQLAKASLEYLQKARYKADAKFTLNQGGSSADISPRARALLEAIAGPESGGEYNVRYGGAGGKKYFTDFSHHPAVFETRPDGRKSSAAGKYQITYTTWLEVQKALHLPDFSPASQDRAAIWIAERDYRARNPDGPTFQEALASDDPAVLLRLKKSLEKTWEGLPNVSAEKFLNKLRTAADGIWNDEKYGNISLEDRLSLSAAAERDWKAEQTAQATAAKAEQDAWLQQQYHAAMNGGYTEEMIQQAWASGKLTEASQEAKLRSYMHEYEKGEGRKQEVMTAFTTGTGVLTPERHDKALNELFLPQATQAFSQRDEAYLETVFLPMVDQLGFVPTGMQNALGAMARGQDADNRVYALDALASLPEGMVKDKGLQQDVELYSAMSQFVPAGEEGQILSMIDARHDPSQQAVLERRTKEADKLLEAYTVEQLPNLIFDNIFISEPDLPVEPSQQFALQGMFNDAYRLGYETFGNADAAEAYAIKQVQKRWGVSHLGGQSRLVLDGVEKFYDRPDLVEAQIREEFSRQGIPEDVPFTVMPTPNARQEGEAWRSGQGQYNASYTVHYQDKNGVWFTLLPEEGDAWTFSGEEGLPYPAEQMQQIETEAKTITLTGRLQEAKAKLAEYQSRVVPQFVRDNPGKVRPIDETEQTLIGQVKAIEAELDSADTDRATDSVRKFIDKELAGRDPEKMTSADLLKVLTNMVLNDTTGDIGNSREYRRLLEIYRRGTE